MYDFVDRRVDALGQGSRFILWAMRAWVMSIGQGRCPPVALAPAFARMGLLAALPDLHMAMAVLNRDALDTLEFAPLPCPRIGEDEALLLALWRDLAAGQRAAAKATLGLMIAEESVALVLAGLADVCAKLGEMEIRPDGLLPGAQAARP